MTKILQGLPEEMCEGSFGSMALSVNIFLAAFFADTSWRDDGFVTDLTYGSKAVARMKEYQRMNGIGQSGNCDMVTREIMKKDDFDFDLIASLRTGRSTFVRRDGSHLEWWPEGKADVKPA